MTALLGKIMAQVLFILALSTKTMKERRISEWSYWRILLSLIYSTEAFLRRLMGRMHIEDSFQRLDALTKEEGLMTVARNLEATYQVNGNVTTIKQIISDVDRNVSATKDCAYCPLLFYLILAPCVDPFH
jgi:hypothetical protein